jgi:16S rRNA A1518/A1519 N6-dimethyltransferase RsmA/KsgA/DIM1 with predicted DNA glycosylase/AP lyase activity
MNSYNVFLTDLTKIAQLERIFEKIQGSILEIGPGYGALTKILPKCDLGHVLVEVNRKRFEQSLEGKDVIWSKIQDLCEVPSKVRSIVSNLPYNQAIKILVHCVSHFRNVHSYHVIIQEQLYRAMTDPKKLLYHKMQHFFKIRKLVDIKRNCFTPVPNVQSVLLHLEVRPMIDLIYYDQLRRITQVRKMIRKSLPYWRDDTRICEWSSAEELYLKWKSYFKN